MASSSFSIVAALVALLLLSATTIGARQLQEVGHIRPGTCKCTMHPELCQPLLDSGNVNTEMDLEIAMINQAINQLKAGISLADSASKAIPESDGKRKGDLKTCTLGYNGAIGELEIALRQLQEASTEQAVVNNVSGLSMAMTNADACTMDLEPLERDGFPLGPATEEIKKMVSNALAINELLGEAEEEEGI